MCDIDQVISQIHFNLLTFTAGVTVVFFFFNAYIYIFYVVAGGGRFLPYTFDGKS